MHVQMIAGNPHAIAEPEKWKVAEHKKQKVA